MMTCFRFVFYFLAGDAIIIKPATLLKFHKALVDRKYYLLFSRKSRRRPGPKGPSAELISLIIVIRALHDILCD